MSRHAHRNLSPVRMVEGYFPHDESHAVSRTALVTCGVVVFLALSSGCANPYSPFGQINHRFVQKPFEVNDEKIGGSGGFPVVLRIVVSPNARGPMAYVGKLVDKALFSDEKRYPDFAFNVAFACARVGRCGESAYADPRSPWFNVFFGYYEIAAPKRYWTRPFGYTSDDPATAQIDFEDIARIGVADWNYFSNHLYGVPLAVIAPLDTIDFGAVKSATYGREQVGSWWWDHALVTGIRVVTPFRSSIDKGQFIDQSTPNVGPLWRRAFGTHDPDASSPTSFFTTEMRAEILMSFDSAHDPDFNEPVYRTLIFGATVTDKLADTSERDRFMALQMKALRTVIERENLGFRDPRRPNSNPQ